jgi:hypothetical protein
MVIVGSFAPSILSETHKQFNLIMRFAKKISREISKSNYLFKGEIDETMLLTNVSF